MKGRAAASVAAPVALGGTEAYGAPRGIPARLVTQSRTTSSWQAIFSGLKSCFQDSKNPADLSTVLTILLEQASSETTSLESCKSC